MGGIATLETEGDAGVEDDGIELEIGFDRHAAERSGRAGAEPALLGVDEDVDVEIPGSSRLLHTVCKRDRPTECVREARPGKGVVDRGRLGWFWPASGQSNAPKVESCAMRTLVW